MFRSRRRLQARQITARRKAFYAGMVALPLLAILTFSNRGLLKRFELENEASTLREQVYSDRAIGDSLRRGIRSVTSDTAVIERVARERFGMIRPGETIYRIDE